MKLIESKTLATAAASIEFTSIPQDGTDLYILISARDNRSNPANGITLFPNGSSSNLSSRNLIGIGSGSGSSTTRTDGLIGVIPSADTTADTFGNIAVYIPNYTGSTNKSMSSDSVQERNNTQAEQWLISALWSDTAAITSITFEPSTADNFVTGTTISLYKIKKGSDGIVTTS
jgi:hypothetical protein